MKKECVGLLFSQIGYDTHKPKRIIIRGYKSWLSEFAFISIVNSSNMCVYKSYVKYFGDFWNIHWWVFDFSDFDLPGVYKIQLFDKNKLLLEADGLEIGQNILFNKTARYVGPENLKRREIFASVKPGWFDAGYLWQEVPSHAMMIVGLCDLYKYAGEFLSDDNKKETLSFIKDGCVYLKMCQDKAKEKGLKEGALIHDLARAPDSCSPYDSFMAALAWAKSADVFINIDKKLSDEFAECASNSLDWIEKHAKPITDNNVLFNQGWYENISYPNQWGTRYLMLALWSEIILYDLNYRKRVDRIDFLTEEILKCQVKKEKSEFGLWGHFYAYEGYEITEKAWSHGMPSAGQNSCFGSDMGAVFSHPLFCFIEGIKRLNNHKYADKWRQAILDFAINYFKPACLSSPFKILPRGVFGKEGLLWFAGVWHGTNTIYGQAAALALEFYKLTGDKDFIDIAYSNLQWICGLNTGLTKDAMEMGCVIFNTDIEDGIAYPVSMIKGVGKKEAGNWTNIRGSICNGFGTGRQFEYDVPPKKDFDAPDALHDEDWITHCGGFLMGIARLVILD